MSLSVSQFDNLAIFSPPEDQEEDGIETFTLSDSTPSAIYGAHIPALGGLLFPP
jgi:hypothetical protein